ncbi:hypothetical protein LMG28688_07154 [Paraburkholderia caffeinitolerans]|uniref:Uncharacterized protein n=1 Tax=Paraburkholderia caffeinitolerans TaxID=1723730 RepID=A0A6J5H0N9_9BURK|nr:MULTISPECIES: hypothetical protein [Paraburkholderia]CAB3810100.1 hypothetical protein LMG28688_07154 [Paraburkholderia caffeinitolerans]
MSLPPFDPPTLAELRNWYAQYRQDESVRRLILEVIRARRENERLDGLLTQALEAARRSGFERLSSDAGPLYEAADRVAVERWRVSPAAPVRHSPFGGMYEDDIDEDAPGIIARARQRQR